MTMCVPTGAAGSTAPIGASCGPQATASAASAQLLPEPEPMSQDALVAIQQLFLASNREDSQSAKLNVESRFNQKRAHQREQAEALERARKAQEEQGGFFDSMGIGSLVGIVTANPVLVLADMTMHMARVTPDFLRDFEKENTESIELATKLYCAVGNASVLADGLITPESIRAAIALGGLLVQETGLLGKDASDWVGAGMIVAGGHDARASGAVVVADKDNAVADEIRTVERETKEYTKWIAAAGMVIAGGAAIVGSLGTATMPVVLIGVALSAGGFAITEKKCLDPLLGKDASMWIGTGMMFSGAMISGAGLAAAAQHVSHTLAEVSRALTVGGNLLDGAMKTRQGLETIQQAATDHEVSGHEREAQKHAFQTQRLQRMVEDIIDSVRDLADSRRRVSQTISAAVETQCQTQLIAAGMRG